MRSDPEIQIGSQILVTSDFERTREEIARRCAQEDKLFFAILKEGNFLVQDAEEALEKAYLASEKEQVILLGAERFSEVVQNKLLKVIEEPPPRKSFILLFRSRAEILPTIRSRLPVVQLDRLRRQSFDELDLAALTIEKVYAFVQSKGRLGADEAKRIVEGAVQEAMKSGEYRFDEKSLDFFRDAVRALDLGSPPAFVLTAVLLKLLAKKRKKNRRS